MAKSIAKEIMWSLAYQDSQIGITLSYSKQKMTKCIAIDIL